MRLFIHTLGPFTEDTSRCTNPTNLSSVSETCTAMPSQFVAFVTMLVALVAITEAKSLRKKSSTFGGLRIRSITDSTPSTTHTVRIQCKNGFFLQIADDGVVNGSTHFSSPNVVLQLHSVGPGGHKRIYSARTKRYVTMNSKGIVTSTVTPTNETVFKYEQLPTGYHTYMSVKHRNGQKPMFLALRDKTGGMKKGTKTTRRHRNSSFLEIR